MLKQIDSILYLLAAMVIFFTVLLFISAKFMENDSQTFQVVASLVTGFAGAFLARVKPPEPKDPPPGSRSTATLETITPPAVVPPPPEN